MKHNKLFLTLILSIIGFQNLFADAITLQQNCVTGLSDTYKLSASTSHIAFNSISKYNWILFKDGTPIQVLSSKNRNFSYQVTGSGDYQVKVAYMVGINTAMQDVSNIVTLKPFEVKIQGIPVVNQLKLCQSLIKSYGIDSVGVQFFNDPTITSSSLVIYPYDPTSGTQSSLSVFSASRNDNRNYIVSGPFNSSTGFLDNVFTQGDDYAFVLTVNNSCGARTFTKYLNIDRTCRLGMNSYSNESINYVYPNPVQDYLNFNDDASSVAKVIVNDLMGTTVKTIVNPMSNTIDLSGLDVGFYNVAFYKTNGEVIVKKISKK